MNYKVYGGLTLLLLVVIFTVQNVTVVSVKFLFWEFSLSRALLIFMVLAAGILIGLFLGSLHHRPKKPGRETDLDSRGI